MDLKEQMRQQARKRFKIEPADLPDGWEGRDLVFMRSLSGLDRDDYEGSRVRLKAAAKRGQYDPEINYTNLRARLVCKSLCDQNGTRIYEDRDAAQVGVEWPGDVLDRLFEQAHRVSGLKRAEELEEEREKNSATSGDASSASPS